MKNLILYAILGYSLLALSDCASIDRDSASTRIVSKPKQTLSIGARAPGDRLLYKTEVNKTFDYPSNAKITIKYPESGLGDVITYFVLKANLVSCNLLCDDEF